METVRPAAAVVQDWRSGQLLHASRKQAVPSPAFSEGDGGGIAGRAGDRAGRHVDLEAVLGEKPSRRYGRLHFHPGAGAGLVEVGQQLAAAISGVAVDGGSSALRPPGGGLAGGELGLAAGGVASAAVGKGSLFVGFLVGPVSSFPTASLPPGER